MVMKSLKLGCCRFQVCQALRCLQFQSALIGKGNTANEVCYCKVFPVEDLGVGPEGDNN